MVVVMILVVLLRWWCVVIVTVVVMVAVRIRKNLFICMLNGCICCVSSGCGGSCVAHLHHHTAYI